MNTSFDIADQPRPSISFDSPRGRGVANHVADPMPATVMGAIGGESGLTSSDTALVEKSPARREWKPSSRLIMAIVALLIVTLIEALDATSLSVALPIMSRKLGGTAIEAFWAGTSFLLASTVFEPLWASISHIFGRKPALFATLVVFTVGTIIAAVANNFTVILVGRTIQGIGGGGILILPEILITDLIPLAERPMYFSIVSGVWALGSVMGPILGGGFAQNVSWRWIFWINLPFVGIAFLLTALFLHLSHRIETLAAKLKRVDWIGMVLFIANATGLLIALSWGGVMYAWDSWHTLVPLILCGVGFVPFVLWEIYGATEPLMRLSLFKIRTTSLTYLITFLHGIVLWCLLYYLPLYYEAVKGYSPIVTGIAIFPETFTVAPAAIVAGIVIEKTGRYRPCLQLGLLLATIGCGILYLMKPGTSIPGYIFLNIVSGLGLGLVFPSETIAVQASAPAADAAFAMGFFSLFRAFGQGVGVAIGGVVFQNEMKRRLKNSALFADRASELSADASGLVQIIKQMKDHSAEKTELIKAYSDSLGIVWVVICALAGVAFIASLFLKEYELNQVQETEQGFIGDKRGNVQDEEVERGRSREARAILDEKRAKSENSASTTLSLPDFPRDESLIREAVLRASYSRDERYIGVAF